MNLFIRLEYNVVKSERKTDFIIQKRSKKSSEGTALVSPIKIIKISDTSSSSIDNLLSTKQLEPVQVHSVVTKLGEQIKQEQFLPKSINVKILINSASSAKNDFDEMK